jgi:hypothetical protein
MTRNLNYIELNREDFIKTKSNISIDKIELTDFKNDSITLEEISNANTIVFVDGNNSRELKNRGII